jgi:hypothetical protein
MIFIKRPPRRPGRGRRLRNEDEHELAPKRHIERRRYRESGGRRGALPLKAKVKAKRLKRRAADVDQWRCLTARAPG